MAGNTVVIFEEVGADPTEKIVQTDHHGHRMTIVAVPTPESVTAVAVDAVNHGADVVELCGGFGPVWHSKVRHAVNGRAKVGAIGYGFESLTGAASYKERFAAGELLPAAFLYLAPDADPAKDRTVRQDETTRTTFIAVPDTETAAKVARDLVDNEGVELIELYGGLGPDGAAAVLDATSGRIPVGLVGYADAQ
jgi:hypothetical protein